MRINVVTQIDEGWLEKLAGHAIGKKTGIDPYQMYLLGKTIKNRKKNKDCRKILPLVIIMLLILQRKNL